MNPMDVGRKVRTVGMGPMDVGPTTLPGGGKSAQPPNLRDAEQEGVSCGECKHFMGQGCAKFNNYPVEGDQVCDAFEGGGEGEGGEKEMGDGASDPYGMEA